LESSTPAVCGKRFSWAIDVNTVFALKRNAFAPSAAYTAADGAQFVGTIDLTTGIITPIVTVLVNPGGLVFVDKSKQDRADSRHDHSNSCHERD